jgi:hypothetical protein
MEINYYEKYLKYKNKYLELKEQLGGKTSRLCHKLNEDECVETNGCARNLEKGRFRYLGCKQKHCWGRGKSFCKNADLQGKSGTWWGTSGCEYDKDDGCRMQCGHIKGEQDCTKLNECEWNGSCAPKANPCRSIQKDKSLSSSQKKKQCNDVKDEDKNKICKIEFFSQRCVPLSGKL